LQCKSPQIKRIIKKPARSPNPSDSEQAKQSAGKIFTSGIPFQLEMGFCCSFKDQITQNLEQYEHQNYDTLNEKPSFSFFFGTNLK
jgi:hypothetical protein